MKFYAKKGCRKKEGSNVRAKSLDRFDVLDINGGERN